MIRMPYNKKRPNKRPKQKSLNDGVLLNNGIYFNICSGLIISFLTSTLIFLHCMVTAVLEELENQKKFLLWFDEGIALLNRDVLTLLSTVQAVRAPTVFFSWESIVLTLVCVSVGFVIFRKGNPPFSPEGNTSEVLTLKDHLLDINWNVCISDNKVENIYVNTFAETDTLLTIWEYLATL